ncbi:hypothetical protein Bca4012_026146 [Brassica carinata]
MNSSPSMGEGYNGQPTFSANSQTNDKNSALGFPSFDLGVTQDAPLRVHVADVEIGDNGDGQCSDPIDQPMPCRKSKRLKLFPTPLVTDYQSYAAILNRAREAKMAGSNYYELYVVEEKFAKLATLLQNPCVINVAGLSFTEKDISDITERSRQFPSKVFDILMRLVRSTFYNQVGCSGDNTPKFLDSRFVTLLARNYDRFKRSKVRESYVFAKGLVDCLVKSCSSGNAATRFYLPHHVDKKHWIGVCVDFTTAKIYILDSNSAVRSDFDLTRDLLPISEMFPFLLKNCAYSALTAALLIQTHAMFGPETCRCLTSAVISDEAHRAAVMLYEFHAKL